jgi:hypothetical protein
VSTIYNVAIFPSSSLQSVAIEGGGVLSATPNKLYVFIYNTNIVAVQGMFDNEQQAYWSVAASLSGTLLDEFGNVVTTVNLLYTSGTNGNFQGEFGGSTFAPAFVGDGYTFVLSGVSDWGNAFNFPVSAQVVRKSRAVGIYAPPTPPG